VGYSQGASIMHLATDRLPASVLPKIKAVVMFGDPNNKLGLLGQFRLALRTKALGVCAPKDPVSFICLFACRVSVDADVWDVIGLRFWRLLLLSLDLY
jgi:hypothetical protein